MGSLSIWHWIVVLELCGEILADTGDTQPVRRREPGHRLGEMGDRIRGIPVRADFERVLTLDFEQICNLSEDARDGEVIHAAAAAGVRSAPVYARGDYRRGPVRRAGNRRGTR